MTDIVMTLTHEGYKLAYTMPFSEPSPLGDLVSGRNGTASFQILLQCPRRCAVSVGMAPWFSRKGDLETLRLEVSAPFPVELFPEGMLPDEDGILRADILLRDEVMETEAGRPAAVWADIAVPADAVPGDYELVVRLWRSYGTGDETLLESRVLPLLVKSCVLPSPGEYPIWLDLWQHNSNIARQYGVALWSDSHFSIIEAFVATLSELGQKSVTVVASEAPWRGQDCREQLHTPANLYEYSMIGLTRGTDGAMRYDFSVMQRYIDLCASYGITGEIEVFGLVNVWSSGSFDREPPCPGYPEPILLRYLDEAGGGYAYCRDAAEITGYVAALAEYFRATGQMERVRIAADEPTDFEKYANSLVQIRRIAPDFQFKTALNHAEFLMQYGAKISGCVPCFECACRRNSLPCRMIQENPPEKAGFLVGDITSGSYLHLDYGGAGRAAREAPPH